MKTPGFWRSIIALLVGVAGGNVALVMGVQAASRLRPPFVHAVFVVSGAAIALLVPYIVCRAMGVSKDVRRALVLSFAIAALPFGLGVCAAEEVARMYGLLSGDVPKWEMTLWRHEHLIARTLFALAFALIAVALCRRERPVSWYRIVAVTLIGISLAWVAKEWLHVHRHWQRPAAMPIPAWRAFMRNTMLCASGHVFLPISLGAAAMLFLWEWPGHVPEEKRKEMHHRNVALGVALATFAALAILRPMVQGPRQMMSLIQALHNDGPLQQKYQDELLRFGRPAVLELKKLSGDSTAVVGGRQCAVKLLGEIDTPETTECLLDVLRDGHEKVRTRAFRVLQDTHPKELHERLIEMLEDEWAQQRYFAAVALGHLRRKPAPTALVLLIQDDSVHVRRAAISALGRIGDASCVPELVTALNDEEKLIRARTTTALMKLGDRRAIPALRGALEDESELVRYLAAEALGHLGDRQVIPVLLEAIEKGCGARASRVRIDTRKMAAALAEVADDSILFNLHSLYRNSTGRAQKDIAYAIDLIRRKQREGKLRGEDKETTDGHR